MSRSNSRRFAAMGAVSLGVAAAVALVLGLTGSPAAGERPSAEQLSGRLAAAPALEEQGALLRAEEEARAVAEQAEADVPLPPGGTLADIHYENATGMTEAALEGVIQFNAACDWWLYVRDRADAPDAAQARRVVGEIPSWSGFQGTGNGEVARSVASGLVGGGDRAEAERLVTANCEHP